MFKPISLFEIIQDLGGFEFESTQPPAPQKEEMLAIEVVEKDNRDQGLEAQVHQLAEIEVEAQ